MATRSKKTTAGSHPRSLGRSAAVAHAVAERREAPRLTLPSVEAEIVSLGLRATVREVGFGGLSIESAHEFQIGEVHTVRSTTPDSTAAALRDRIRVRRSVVSGGPLAGG